MPKDPANLRFDSDFAEELCERLATTPGADGSLKRVLAAMLAAGFGKISERTVYYWRAHQAGFKEAYRQAREMQGELDLDDGVIEASTTRIGKIETTERRGKEKEEVTSVKTVDNVERSKLIVVATWQRAKSHNKELCSDRLDVAASLTVPLAEAVAEARKRAASAK